LSVNGSNGRPDLEVPDTERKGRQKRHFPFVRSNELAKNLFVPTPEMIHSRSFV